MSVYSPCVNVKVWVPPSSSACEVGMAEREIYLSEKSERDKRMEEGRREGIQGDGGSRSIAQGKGRQGGIF